MKGCKVDGCEKQQRALGLCNTHYFRQWSTGTTEKIRRLPTVTYRGVHNRLDNERGKASEYDCDDCGATAHEWAYDHSDPDPLVQTVGTGWSSTCEVEYSPDLCRYVPLCRSCHRTRDRDNGAGWSTKTVKRLRSPELWRALREHRSKQKTAI